jgi:hypothetical protein
MSHEVAGDGASRGETPGQGVCGRQEPFSLAGSLARWLAGSLARVIGSTPPANPGLRLRDDLPSRLHSISREVDLFGSIGGLGLIPSGGTELV